MRFFVIVIGIPLIEIAGFILVGGWIGLWPTLGLILLAAMAGVMLLRAQGLSAMRALQTGVAGSRNPLGLVADKALVLLAAGLLIVPGFLGDLVALALLVPQLRAALIAALAPPGSAGGAPDGPDDMSAEFRRKPDIVVIDADYIEVEPPIRGPRNGPSGWSGH
jgi:UPF0716 protein FxsA